MPSPADSEMANLRAELEALTAPPIPRPVPPVRDPVFQTWRKDFQAYVDHKTELVEALRGGGVYAVI